MPGYKLPEGYAPPFPRKKSRAVLYGVVVVAVIVVVIGGYLAYSAHSSSTSTSSGSPTVDITAINLNPTSETATCWTPWTNAGGNVTAGQSFSTTSTLSYTAKHFQPQSCTVQSVSTQTAGFSIVSVNTPLVVASGGTQTLTIVIGTPSSSSTGAVTIDLTVTAP